MYIFMIEKQLKDSITDLVKIKLFQTQKHSDLAEKFYVNF